MKSPYYRMTIIISTLMLWVVAPIANADVDFGGPIHYEVELESDGAGGVQLKAGTARTTAAGPCGPYPLTAGSVDPCRIVFKTLDGVNQHIKIESVDAGQSLARIILDFDNAATGGDPNKTERATFTRRLLSKDGSATGNVTNALLEGQSMFIIFGKVEQFRDPLIHGLQFDFAVLTDPLWQWTPGNITGLTTQFGEFSLGVWPTPIDLRYSWLLLSLIILSTAFVRKYQTGSGSRV